MPPRSTSKVVDVIDGCPAEKAGIKSGDRIISVNGHTIHDELDLFFYTHDEFLSIKIDRDGKRISKGIHKDEYEPIGLTLEPLKIKKCGNNCVFCFVSQLPRGLRRSLYVKDEDYRFSFLYGNYVTLSNLSEYDRKRIAEQRLSPLYISVHTTNPGLRRKMLGNRNSSDIMLELKELKSSGIRFHTQIVLCPGYNDRDELKRTINDLAGFYPYTMSIAVVPVGLTAHRRKKLDPVTGDDAKIALLQIESLQENYIKKLGDPLVYGADELFIKAGVEFPDHSLYGDFPQIENGVGMIPDFIHRSKYIRLSSYDLSNKRFVTITGTSFFPYLERFIGMIRKRSKVRLELVPVTNALFGESVTVTGLLTGRDIIRELSKLSGSYDIVLLPDVLFRDSDNILLDDLSIEDIRSTLNTEVRIIRSDPKGLINGMEESYEH